MSSCWKQISHITWTPCLYQWSGNWCLQLYDDRYICMLYSMFRLESGKNVDVWMLEIDYFTGYSVHTSGRTCTCEDQQSSKPSAATSTFPPQVFTVEITLATCKWARVLMSEHYLWMEILQHWTQVFRKTCLRSLDRCFVMESVTHATAQEQTTPHESHASTVI